MVGSIKQINQWNALFSCLCCLSLSGCSDNIRASADIRNRLKLLVESSSAVVDLASVGPSSWSRVCVLPPYSNNETARQVLSFDWDVELKSTIDYRDSITLLLFARSDSVVASVEYPRGDGDFSTLETGCLNRENAKLVRHQSDDGISFSVFEE